MARSKKNKQLIQPINYYNRKITMLNRRIKQLLDEVKILKEQEGKILRCFYCGNPLKIRYVCDDCQKKGLL